MAINIMRQAAIILILFATLLPIFQSKQLNLTCVDCSIACSTGTKCYKYSGLGLTQEVCSNSSTCLFNAQINYEVGSCAVDITGSPCSTKICAQAVDANICMPNLCFGSTYTSAFACNTCNKTSNCKSCISTNTLGFSIEICIDQYLNGSSCNYSASTTISTCLVDSFGGACNCCGYSVYSGMAGACVT